MSKTTGSAVDPSTDPDDPHLSIHRVTAAEALDAMARGAARLFDVRRRPARERSGLGLRDAPWRDPESLAPDAIADAAGAQTVIVFCVHGHGVSQEACEKLRRAGCSAYFVSGGVDALLAVGAETRALADDEGEVG